MDEGNGFSYEEISEPYYFETDHVALKENTDYRNMLHAIALLEAQRQQAAKDIDILYKAQAEALANPLTFVEKLQKGHDLCLPKLQKIAPIPEVDWSLYSSSTDLASFSSSQHMTRNKKNIASDVKVEQLSNKLGQSTDTTPTTLEKSNNVQEPDSDVVVIRGRARDRSKPATFNQLWTEEEQQRLERLLIEFPPEEVESKRWAKIANALGNRTTVQVASRVQKYFVRLAKEGLPIPGRMPNLSVYMKKGSHRHQRYNRMYYQSSTLMQAHTPPVWMRDEDDDRVPLPGPSMNNLRTGPVSAPPSEDSTPAPSETNKDDSSDEDDLPPELMNTPEFRELQRLKNLKRQIKTQQSQAAKHIGYKCDKCGCEPIIGTRWHCTDCPEDMSLDFCDKCCDLSFQTEKHDSSHRLEPFKLAVMDSDYMSTANTDYNYLDPNYMPAN